MSIAKIRSRAINSRKITPQRSINIRKNFIKMIERIAKKDKIKSNVNIDYTKKYSNIIKIYMNCEINEIAAIVSAVEKDDSILERKYKAIDD